MGHCICERSIADISCALQRAGIRARPCLAEAKTGEGRENTEEKRGQKRSGACVRACFLLNRLLLFYPTACLSVCLSNCLSFSLSVCLSVYLSLFLRLSLRVLLAVTHGFPEFCLSRFRSLFLSSGGPSASVSYLISLSVTLHVLCLCKGKVGALWTSLACSAAAGL